MVTDTKDNIISTNMCCSLLVRTEPRSDGRHTDRTRPVRHQSDTVWSTHYPWNIMTYTPSRVDGWVMMMVFNSPVYFFIHKPRSPVCCVGSVGCPGVCICVCI